MQEIYDILRCYERTEKRKKKEHILDLFVVAEVTANRILAGFDSKSSESDLLQPWHFYPELFEDMSKGIEERREMLETERFKAHMEARIEAWNKRFREEHNEDDA